MTRRAIFGFALGVSAGMVAPVDAATQREKDEARSPGFARAREIQVTSGPGARILTNVGVWSPDGNWIVYDTRPDASGEVFDGTRIEAVNVGTGEVRRLYETRRGARCGVVTFHPTAWRVVFIHGPEDPTPEWSYGPFHRQGVMVDWERPGVPIPLDARDLAAPFTPGALRGGSHVHVFSGDGRQVSFTYEDHVLAQASVAADPGADSNQRNIGVSVVDRAVRVGTGHARNHDGSAFTVLVTRTTNRPRPGSDEILKAYEEGWVGREGYVRPEGGRQRALAFLGNVVGPSGGVHAEVFIVDLPEDLSVAGDGPLEGTERTRPLPPRGVVQRRLTFTQDRLYPGVQGPRHWLRASLDGGRIAYLAKDDAGVVQVWTVSPLGGEPRQVTRGQAGVTSAFTWSPDGRWLAHTMGGSVCVTDMETGATHRLTVPCRDGELRMPRPEACVFSPEGRRVAFVRREEVGDGVFANQICVVGW